MRFPFVTHSSFSLGKMVTFWMEFFVLSALLRLFAVRPRLLEAKTVDRRQWNATIFYVMRFQKIASSLIKAPLPLVLELLKLVKDVLTGNRSRLRQQPLPQGEAA